jgi:hypothetical protein
MHNVYMGLYNLDVSMSKSLLDPLYNAARPVYVNGKMLKMLSSRVHG